MLQSLMPIIVLLSWLALPVTPDRASSTTGSCGRGARSAPRSRARDPPLMTRAVLRAAGAASAAAVLRLLLAERLDFSAGAAGDHGAHRARSGLLDRLLFAPRARRRGARRRQGPGAHPEPGTVDYARSFFPVALVVLVLRSFIFEPFRIPSDSMMPTLLDGDFIIVNKYAYGLRLPVINRKIVHDRRAAARRCGGVPLPARPVRQLHQAPGGPAGRSCARCMTTSIIVNGKPVPLHDRRPLRRRLLRQHAARPRAARQPRTRRSVCPVADRLVAPPLPGCNRSGDAQLRLRRAEDAAGRCTTTATVGRRSCRRGST